MPDAFLALRQREEAEAERLANAAQAIGQGALSRATVAAAKVVIAAITKHGGDAINAAAAELRTIRTNSALMQALAKDLASATHAGLAAILDALQAGYTTDAHARAQLTAKAADGVNIHVELTKADLADLADFPVQGFTPQEWATDLSIMLRRAVDGALAQPLTGALNLAAIAPVLGDVARQHGGRLAQAVRESYFAGTKAATDDLTAAILAAKPAA